LAGHGDDDYNYASPEWIKEHADVEKIKPKNEVPPDNSRHLSIMDLVGLGLLKTGEIPAYQVRVIIENGQIALKEIK
jgi:hypothetical protein